MEWKKLLFKFTQIGGSLAHAMKASMEKRETVLLENDVLLAAVFVDPMYRITLTEEQQERGRKALLSIALDMKENEERKLRTNVENEGQSCSRNLSSASDSEDEDFEKHLDRQAKRRKMQIDNAADHSSPP